MKRQMENAKKVICFLCRCYGEVSGIIDLDSLQKRLEQNPCVSSVEIWDSLCLDEKIEYLASSIKTSYSEKTLIVACSFLARGDTILTGLEGKGVDPATIELVDIREGCAWIHKNHPEGATNKTWDLINMGLASLLHRGRSDDVTIDVKHEVLVVGAGPAGLSAAASLGRMGIKVHLIDRAKTPGGMLNMISTVGPEGVSSREMLSPYLEEVESNLLISFGPSTRIGSVEGSAGDFTVRLLTESDERTVHVGAIIISTGLKAVLPLGLYRYGELKGVISAIELERLIKSRFTQARGIVYIQCVAARDEKRPYCSAICCPVNLKNAMKLQEDNTDMEVYILHRDIVCPGSVLEAYYQDALSKGIKFVRFDKNNPPVIEGEDHVEAVSVYDAITGTTRRIDTDMVVLSTPLAAHDDTVKIAQMIGLAQDRNGFFEVRTLMHPLETTVGGVFVCGSARWPVLAQKAIFQGEAAAMKAFSLLSKEKVISSRLSQFKDSKFAHARVSLDACTGCGNCVAICPYDACSLEKVHEEYKSTVNAMCCTGCGSCVAVCPNGSIQLPEQNATVIGEMLKQAFS